MSPKHVLMQKLRFAKLPPRNRHFVEKMKKKVGKPITSDTEPTRRGSLHGSQTKVQSSSLFIRSSDKIISISMLVIQIYSLEVRSLFDWIPFYFLCDAANGLGEQETWTSQQPQINKLVRMKCYWKRHTKLCAGIHPTACGKYRECGRLNLSL